jgi:phosphoglycerate dehydrogenase-like enzyme
MSRISPEPWKISSPAASFNAEMRYVRHYPALVKVTSPSFSSDQDLRAELLAIFPRAIFNTAGRRLSDHDLRVYLADAEAAVVGLERIDEPLLAACPLLKIVAKYGVGLDNLDLDACRAHGVAVAWTPGTNARSVAELTLCFLLGLFRNVFATSTRLRGGEWKKEGGRQLTSATIGIVGLGHVGKDLVRVLKPFGCRVLANDIVDVGDFCAEHGVELVDKRTLYRMSDAVTLHVPLTPDTRGLIDEAALRCFKPGAFLVNTSRGEVVDQPALKRSLAERHLGGAALDVFEVEPPADRDLIDLPTLVATAHIGGAAREAVLATGRSAISNLERFFDREEPPAGQPPGSIRPVLASPAPSGRS